MAKKTVSPMVQYVLYTYGLFGLLLATLGGIATLVFGGALLAMKLLITITAWTSTYVFLIMFPRLYPDSTLRGFLREAFAERPNIRLLATTTSIQVAIFATCVCMVSIRSGIGPLALLDLSPATLISTAFFVLIQGPMGEEIGWRGYLLPAIKDRVGLVKGALVVSLIWSFWHAPIWFLGTGYRGEELCRYIIVFVVSVTSVGFVIGLCYHHNRNLVVAIWIHFIFNFLGEVFTGTKVDLVTWYAAFYPFMAIGFYLWNRADSAVSTAHKPARA